VIFFRIHGICTKHLAEIPFLIHKMLVFLRIHLRLNDGHFLLHTSGEVLTNPM
jgi:hypothetical protein